MQRPSPHVANASRSRFARSRVYERTTTRWHRWPQSRRWRDLVRAYEQEFEGHVEL